MGKYFTMAGDFSLSVFPRKCIANYLLIIIKLILKYKILLDKARKKYLFF